MNDLLRRAVTAHGGLDRWTTFIDIEARFSIKGTSAPFRSMGEALGPVTFLAATREECAVIRPFLMEDHIGFFEPNYVSIETFDEQVLEHRDQPHATYVRRATGVAWDSFDFLYFCGYTLWTSLTTPFLYTYPGFESEELAPVEEAGEEWRRLSVLLPAHIACHSPRQICYFGPDGLLRRQDHISSVLGDVVREDVSVYDEFDGIIVPSVRQLYQPVSGNGRSNEAALLVIELDAVAFR